MGWACIRKRLDLWGKALLAPALIGAALLGLLLGPAPACADPAADATTAWFTELGQDLEQGLRVNRALRDMTEDVRVHAYEARSTETLHFALGALRDHAARAAIPLPDGFSIRERDVAEYNRLAGADRFSAFLIAIRTAVLRDRYWGEALLQAAEEAPSDPIRAYGAAVADRFARSARIGTPLLLQARDPEAFVLTN